MTTPVNETPVAIDYTSRDYYSLREELIARVKNNVNVPGSGVNWTGNDPADFGVAIIEAFSYMGDVVNYYIDRIANESYIGTATQRQSIINLAKTYGYFPSGYRNASADFVFYNDSSSIVVVPAGTQVSGQVVYNDTVHEVIYTLDVDTSVPAAVDGVPGQSDPTTLVEGELVSSRSGNDPLYGEQLGFSGGIPEQVFILSENQVVENSIEVYVQVGDSDSYELWRRVTHLADYGPTDAVYTIDTDADNFVYVTFGDGISGAIPTHGATVKANYYIGGGQIGNVASGAVDSIRKVPSGYSIPSVTSVNTTAGVGGADPESNGSIRFNAPKSLSALNRAVTLKDYASLALGVTNVGKANAIAETKNSVTLYVSPQQASTSTDLYPGYTEDPADTGVLTSDWSTMQADVTTYLEDKTQIGVSVTVSPPTYVKVNLLAYFTKLPQYTTAQVKANIISALVTRFSYDYLAFEDIISPEEIEYKLRQVEGVYSIRVMALYKAGQTGRNTLLGGPGEIFVFEEANMDITAASSDAQLSDLTFSVGTLSPVFTSGLFNYNLAVPTGTTSVDVTPTNTTASITVSGTPTASGAAHAVTTAVGTTTVPVVVTAQDGITTQAYRITITRAS